MPVFQRDTLTKQRRPLFAPPPLVHTRVWLILSLNSSQEHKVKSEAVRAETIKFFKNINHDDEETSKMMNDILKGGAGPGGRENR